MEGIAKVNAADAVVLTNAPRTMLQKIWDEHIVAQIHGNSELLYIDRHLVNEVTSPQAFEGLRRAGRAVRRPDLTFAVADHNVPTDADRGAPRR